MLCIQENSNQINQATRTRLTSKYGIEAGTGTATAVNRRLCWPYKRGKYTW